MAVIFGIDNLAASASATQLYVSIPGSAAVASQQGYVFPFRGSIIGLSFRANASVSAGSATFTVYKEAVAMPNTKIDWSSGSDSYVSFPEGTYGFVAGEELDVRVSTTSAYSPTTTDIMVCLFVLLDTSTVQ
jgi:hypothetical protein